jgi:pimeloyl-ACP methyl ester carboxylesterase
MDYEPRDKPSRRFPTLDEGTRAFNPGHPIHKLGIRPDLLRHVAETSLRQEGETWRWKRDDKYNIVRSSMREMLPKVTVPLAIIRTEHGVVTNEMAAEMAGLTQSPCITVTIPAAGHNPMLEQPIALISVLRTLLATWWPAP